MAQTHSLDLERGSSQTASITDASQTGLDAGSTISFEAWIKIESWASSGTENRGILTKCANDNQGYNFWVQVSTTGVNSFHTRFNQGSGTSRVYNVTGTAVTGMALGVWYHLAFTFDLSGDTGIGYVNGSTSGVTTTAAASAISSIANSSSAFMLGNRRTDLTDYWDGLLKDVRVFSDVRTAAEIASDAGTENVSDANLVGEWNLNNAYTDSSGNGNTLTASGSPVFSTDIPWEGATQISGSTYLATNLVSYWDLDGDSNDSAGSSNGTDTSVTYSSGNGKVSQGAGFNGTSSKVAIPDNVAWDFGTGNFSISLWARKDGAMASGGNFIHLGNGASKRIYFAMTSANEANAQFYDGTNGAALSTSAISSPTNYHHYVMVRTGGVLSVYVDGIFSASASNTYGTSANSNLTGFTGGGLGESKYNFDWFNGAIDEVAVYSRALHYGDVLDLYNAGSGITYSASTAYTVTAALGTYALTGVAAGLKRGYTVAANLGTFALTGVVAALSLGKGIVMETGAFVLTGSAAALSSARTFAADAGSFLLTGVVATLSRGFGFAASAGSYALTGLDAAFIKGYGLVASAGSFAVTGVAAVFTKGSRMVAAAGSYVLTGFAARFPRRWTNVTRHLADPSNTVRNLVSWINQDKTDL